LSGASNNDQSGILSGESTYTGTTTSETAYSSSQSRALTNIPPRRKLDFDTEPLTILEEAACFLLEACQGEMSECPSVPSKYTLDSFISSEYGTEIIFNTPKTTVNRPHTPIHEPERIVTERKPRMSSNGSRGLVTPSPTKKPSKSSSPMAKRMNPLKLITKSQSSKKNPKPSLISRQTTPTKEITETSSSRPGTPASVRPATPSKGWIWCHEKS
jgi:hypothetical protein